MYIQCDSVMAHGMQCNAEMNFLKEMLKGHESQR